MSRRTDRIGSLIRTLVAEAIQTRLSDPRIVPITSITRVQVSEDLSVARIAVSVMGSETQRQECLRALRRAAGRLRSLLGEELTLRKLPVLAFRLDDSIRGSFETVQQIERAMQALGPEPAAPPDAATAGLAEDAGTPGGDAGGQEGA